MRRQIGLAAVTVMVGAAAANAQEPVVMDELLVTGGRTPIGVNETGRAHTVITGEQLEARGTRYLADALRQVPGLAVSRTGSFGGFTQIRVRGAEANQVLVLVDGLEIAPAGGGEVDFGSLLVTDIERVEVLRGPQSALFGSNAAAGVISIITRRGERGEVSTRGAVEGGSDGTALVSGTIAGGGATWDAALGARFRRTDGFNIATGTDDRDGEKDGDRNITLTGRASLDVTEDLSFSANLFFVDRESDFDDQIAGIVIDADNVTDATDIAVGASVGYEMLDDALVNQLTFGFTRNTSDSLSDGALSFGSESLRFKVGNQLSLAFQTGEIDHLLTGIVEFENEQNETSLDVDESRTLFGLGGEYRIAYGPAALQTSLRNDFNDEFEDALTFSVSGAYSIAATATRLHGSVGRGIVNPTFGEQFGFFPGTFIGNPDLIPERSFQWDLGVEQTLFDGQLIVDATYFRGQLTDEIIGGFDDEAGLPTSVNAEGESPRQGVELSLTAFPIDGLTVTGSYTYTLAEQEGVQEVRRPRHLGSIDATYRFLEGRATLNGNLVFNGDQLDTDFSDFSVASLDSFVLVSVQGSYAVTENLEVYARVENATNSDYQEVLNFETQGVAGFAGLRVSF